MAEPLYIDVNEQQLRDAVRALEGIKDGAATAVMRSVNKSLTGVKTDMARETVKILNVTQKRVKKDMKVRKASKIKTSGAVSTKGRPVNLIEFKAKGNKKGVSVKVLKSGGRSTVKHAFIFIGKNDNRLVGQRWAPGDENLFQKKADPTMSYGGLPKKYRLPIESLTGPRIQDITGRPDVMNTVQDQAGVRLVKELDHQVEYLLNKAKR